MAFNNLLSAGANPGNTAAQLLHIGEGDPAFGAQVLLGDETPTALMIYEGYLGAKFKDSAEAGELEPARVARLTSDFANDTVTGQPVTGLSLPLAVGTWELDGTVLLQTANLSYGADISLTGPAGTDLVSYCWNFAWNTTWAFNLASQYHTAFGTWLDSGAFPAANTPIPGFLRGIVRVTATPNADLGLQLRSSSAGVEAKVRAAVLRARKIG